MAQSPSGTAMVPRPSPPAKTVVITGAGSGIGLAAAIHFGGNGWRVGLVGRGREALADAKRLVEQAGGSAHAAAADVSDAAALEAAAAEIEAELGPIEVWVNNAAIGYFGPFSATPEDAFRRIIEVNLIGTVNGTRTALRRMQPRNRGTIVQVLSAIAYRGAPMQSAYSASKYGLRGFTEALRSDLLGERSAVHVTMVHPPAVNTPFYSHAGTSSPKSPRPPPPVFQPELIGEAIYLAATGERRREWRVTGVVDVLAGANRAVPGLVDFVGGLVGNFTQTTRNKKVAAARDINIASPSTRAAGMHGPFDRESLRSSVHWSITKSPAPVRLALGLLAFGLMGAMRRGR